ncbi:hypothetical protein HPP92_019634 [Vanilla planifolia]|uniref:Amino acid transporter transmembrane domain-containing protein n=1 Tax=Vanilla planifolia TaxID=51239 RepID=A0A835Q380_VANPL|nr:hypothetical protein HPP92_019634 [Vanilla planifolia]
MAQGWVERGLEDAETEMNLSTTLDVDDDGRPRRTGTLWTASSHIITAVIGSGVLSLGWAMAQLGWLIGPFVLFVFSAITLFTSRLLADCYRSEKTGKRNYNYMSAVKSNLGRHHPCFPPLVIKTNVCSSRILNPSINTGSWKIYMCGICQYVNLCGTSVGYCITSGISAAAVIKSNCFHEKGHEADCNVQYSYYMVGFGMIQIVLSQLPDLHNITWLSVLAAVMSFSYSIIGVVLAMYQVISGDVGVTSLTGTVIGVDVTGEEKVWNAFQALGNIAFAYSYSMVLIEIQDTLKSPPPENKVMKKASFIGVTTTTVFYMFCGCFGYAAFGNKAPGNMLTGFGFYEPFWLVDIANICIVIHLLGAYQVFCQPIFAVVEDSMSKWKPGLKLLTNEVKDDMENNICCVEYYFGNHDALLQWHTWFLRSCSLLASHCLLPNRNVHGTEEDQEAESQGDDSDWLELCMLACVFGSSHCINQRGLSISV